MAFDTSVYPAPTASPFADIGQYAGLLLAAVDAELDRWDVWDESEADTALGYVQDLKAWLVDNLPPPTTPGVTMYALIRDEKPSGSDGGPFSSGAWQRRDLNAVASDLGGFVTLASNQVTLPAGSYRVRAICPAYYVNRHQARLQNVTDGTTVALGTSAYAVTTGYEFGHSEVVGYFTIVAAKTFELQHRCETSRTGNGFGEAAAFGTEIYSVLELWKEA